MRSARRGFRKASASAPGAGPRPRAQARVAGASLPFRSRGAALEGALAAPGAGPGFDRRHIPTIDEAPLMNKRPKISARLWIHPGTLPRISLHIPDDRKPRTVVLSLEAVERLRNVVDAKLGEARRLGLPIEGIAPHAA